MKIRRDAAVMEATERYKRQDKEHPNRKVVEEPRPKQRIKKKSILSVADDLKEKYKLPKDREPIYLFDAEYNYDSQKKAPYIKKQLVKDIGKKQSDPLDLMSTALKTIDQYPDDWVHIYTDGSASNGTRDAGYGARIHFPDQSCK